LRSLAPVAPILLAGLVPALAQESPPAPGAADANPFGRKYPARVYETRRLEGKPPSIDGRLDDEAWTQEVNAGNAPAEQYFVMKNLAARIDELVAAKAAGG
jgi:hypothetical protein